MEKGQAVCLAEALHWYAATMLVCGKKLCITHHFYLLRNGTGGFSEDKQKALKGVACAQALCLLDSLCLWHNGSQNHSMYLTWKLVLVSCEGFI